MGEVVNLRRARKAIARRTAEDAAQQARVKHGTPKKLHVLNALERELDARRLAAHRLEGRTPEER